MRPVCLGHPRRLVSCSCPPVPTKFLLPRSAASSAEAYVSLRLVVAIRSTLPFHLISPPSHNQSLLRHPVVALPLEKPALTAVAITDGSHPTTAAASGMTGHKLFTRGNERKRPSLVVSVADGLGVVAAAGGGGKEHDGQHTREAVGSLGRDGGDAPGQKLVHERRRLRRCVTKGEARRSVPARSSRNTLRRIALLSCERKKEEGEGQHDGGASDRSAREAERAPSPRAGDAPPAR